MSRNGIPRVEAYNGIISLHLALAYSPHGLEPMVTIRNMTYGGTVLFVRFWFFPRPDSNLWCATSIVAALHWRDRSFSVEEISDEISATGSHQIFPTPDLPDPP